MHDDGICNISLNFHCHHHQPSPMHDDGIWNICLNCLCHHHHHHLNNHNHHHNNHHNNHRNNHNHHHSIIGDNRSEEKLLLDRMALLLLLCWHLVLNTSSLHLFWSMFAEIRKTCDKYTAVWAKMLHRHKVQIAKPISIFEGKENPHLPMFTRSICFDSSYAFAHRCPNCRC